MNSDRQLLELAAKVAGVSGQFVEKFPEDGYPNYSCGIGNGAWVTPLWNPLANDGDAFRLAVNLGSGDLVLCLSIGRGKTGCEFLFESHGTDPYFATRRAIVCAAAELGKAAR